MDRLMTMPEVASALQTPIDTLRYWRQKGSGPPSFRIGRRVMYREAEVTSWVDRQAGAQERA